MKNRQWLRLHYVPVFVLAASLFLLLGIVTIALATASVDETDLTPSGSANEVNHGPDGLLYISDADAQEIWRISPADSDYTRYQNVGTVVDARPDGSGQIWWTDGATAFSTLSPGSTTKTAWSLSGLESLYGVAFDESGHVWMSEFFGSSATIHRFNPDSSEHCTYAVAGGLPSNYIQYHEGFLWLVDWTNERIVRFNPTTLAVQTWAIPPVAGNFEWDFDIDQAGHLWWTDLTASLSRLDPETNERTRYEIPDVNNSTTLMVNAAGSVVRYTDSSENTVGWLAPAGAAGETTTLSVTAATATESCETLEGTTSAVVTETGTFAWMEGTLTTLVDAGGWSIYALPEDASLYGLAPGGDHLWVADNGRQKLLRLLMPEIPEENEQLFLPALFGT